MTKTENVTKYSPLTILNRLQSELSPWLSFGSLVGDDSSNVATGQWIPAVDIKETKNDFIIRADLPGIEPENIEVSMEDGILTLKGKREEEKKEEEGNQLRIERVTGIFYRRFSLPNTADSENIQAEFNRGVLKITIPKKQEAMARKISIKASEGKKGEEARRIEGGKETEENIDIPMDKGSKEAVNAEESQHRKAS